MDSTLKDHAAMERTLRFGADRICLWCLCGDAKCARAKACRGDVRRCAALITQWLEALDAAQFARPSFAEIERALATPQDLRAYRVWRDALGQVHDTSHETRATRASKHARRTR